MRLRGNGVREAPTGRRPRRTSLDPAWFRNGDIGHQTAVTDRYFLEALPADVLTMVVDRLVERLDEPDRSCVQMVTLGGMTYQECAELLEASHRKTVWKWEKRGLEQIKEWIGSAGWLREMIAERLPEDVAAEAAGETAPAALEDALTRTLTDTELDHE